MHRVTLIFLLASFNSLNAQPSGAQFPVGGNRYRWEPYDLGWQPVRFPESSTLRPFVRNWNANYSTVFVGQLSSQWDNWQIEWMLNYFANVRVHVEGRAPGIAYVLVLTSEQDRLLSLNRRLLAADGAVMFLFGFGVIPSGRSIPYRPSPRTLPGGPIVIEINNRQR